MTNKQNSKFAQHILETEHTYNTMDQTLEVLHIEKEGPKLNTLERLYIYHLTKKGLQMNDSFTDTHNPIFDILIKNTLKKPYPFPTTPATHRITTSPSPTSYHSTLRRLSYTDTPQPKHRLHRYDITSRRDPTTQNIKTTKIYVSK
jgi:hypothetical protein